MGKSEREQDVINNFKFQQEKLLKDGYKENKCIISIVAANVVAALIGIGMIIILMYFYNGSWMELIFSYSKKQQWSFFLIVFLFIFIHELLHGIGWIFFCKNSFKSIRFGVMWNTLTPYCHCREPLNFKGYIIGLIMPFLVIGIGILVLAIWTKSIPLYLLSSFNIAGASGDLMIGIKLLKYRNALILDHPTEGGFYAFEK